MGNEWYYLTEQTVKGPISATELKQLAAAGRICASTSVLRGIDGAWVQASQVRGLLNRPRCSHENGSEAVHRGTAEPSDTDFAIVAEKGAEQEHGRANAAHKDWRPAVVIGLAVVSAVVGAFAWVWSAKSKREEQRVAAVDSQVAAFVEVAERQLENGRLDEAEKLAQQALAIKGATNYARADAILATAKAAGEKKAEQARRIQQQEEERFAEQQRRAAEQEQLASLKKEVLELRERQAEAERKAEQERIAREKLENARLVEEQRAREREAEERKNDEIAQRYLKWATLAGAYIDFDREVARVDGIMLDHAGRIEKAPNGVRRLEETRALGEAVRQTGTVRLRPMLRELQSVTPPAELASFHAAFITKAELEVEYIEAKGVMLQRTLPQTVQYLNDVRTKVNYARRTWEMEWNRITEGKKPWSEMVK